MATPPNAPVLFKGPLNLTTQDRVVLCDNLLSDPARLAALRETKLMGSAREEAFDRIADLAAKILNVPLTIISFVSDDSQFFKAGFGLPAPFDTLREIPIDSSICRYTLGGEAIIASDASKHELLGGHPTTEPWGIGAFIALPMITKEGHVLGAFCAVNARARTWSEQDIFVMRELTSAVMTEIDLRSQIDKLESERALRTKFVATLTHDLRTPIAVAKMAGQLLDDPLLSSEDRGKVLTMIGTSMDRADQMIQDLLDSSRLRNGEELHLNLTDCDLREIAQSTVDSLASLHKAQIHLHAEGAFPGRWDNSGLRRILENLIGNAVKYREPQSPINVTLTGDDRQVRLQVHNIGNPIAAENLPNLFAPFHRDLSTRGSQPGWGLGLTLVRGFCEAMGGSVSVASSNETGTTFTVTLPREIIVQ